MSQQKTMAQKSMSGQFHELMEKPGIINALGRMQIQATAICIMSCVVCTSLKGLGPPVLF